MEADRTATVAAGAGTTACSSTPGRILSVLVTTAGTGTGQVLFYDNAAAGSGTIIAAIPATVAAGAFYAFGMPAAFGVVAVNPANGPALTVSVR
jgi:hypothetical protein